MFMMLNVDFLKNGGKLQYLLHACYSEVFTPTGVTVVEVV